MSQASRDMLQRPPSQSARSASADRSLSSTPAACGVTGRPSRRHQDQVRPAWVARSAPCSSLMTVAARWADRSFVHRRGVSTVLMAQLKGPKGGPTCDAPTCTTVSQPGHACERRPGTRARSIAHL